MWDGGLWANKLESLIFYQKSCCTHSSIRCLACIGAGLFGSIGTFGFGYLCDRYGENDKRMYMWIPGIAILCTIPPLYLSLTVVDVTTALIISLLPPIFTTCYLGSCLAVFHGAVEPRMRATSSALFFLILNIVGLGCGPTLIGMLSDALTPNFGVDSLRYSLLIMVPAACVWAAIHFVLSAKHYKQSET